MPTSISALKHTPGDFVREISPDAITFYVDELSGIYLPDDFKDAHSDIYGVESWNSSRRLQGKFGRFALKQIGETAEEDEPCGDIMIMGTTIGLCGLDRYNDMESLRHYTFKNKIWDIVKERGLSGNSLHAEEVDYGSTTIRLPEDGEVIVFGIGGASIDFGRANTEGRQKTCDIVAQLLGDNIEVVNMDPEPRARQRIIGNPA